MKVTSFLTPSGATSLLTAGYELIIALKAIINISPLFVIELWHSSIDMMSQKPDLGIFGNEVLVFSVLI